MLDGGLANEQGFKPLGLAVVVGEFDAALRAAAGRELAEQHGREEQAAEGEEEEMTGVARSAGFRPLKRGLRRGDCSARLHSWLAAA
ncbi:hypothetical protein LBMAG56_22850 [Verrucomicrobiota bacterium]|nr:hypothetical protein LBMAG56_22850 [Verrucomicrobiota bacterium]